MALSSHCWRRSCVWCSSNRITPGPWPRCKRSLRGSSGASRSRASSRGVGLIRSRGHVPKGGYDVPNGSNHTSAVTPAIQGVVARIVTGSHDANRRESYLPMRYDADRPRAVIRFKISQPRTTSLPCQLGSGGPNRPTRRSSGNNASRGGGGRTPRCLAPWRRGRAPWAGCGPDVRRGGHPEIDADHGIFGR